jgi:hypothetical protein
VTGQNKEYVLVPRVPTKEMLKAAWADALGEDAAGVWRSMIEAFEDQLDSSGNSFAPSGTFPPLK